MSGLSGKIALITGASRGIGASAAKRLAKEGAHVILVARTVGGLEEVDDAIKSAGGESTLVPLDLTQFEKIDELGGIIAKKFGRLDILVGNAGILGGLTPVPHIEPTIWDKIIKINVTANYRLIRSFDPLLRTSKAGRAMFVTSGIAATATPFWGGYAVSKAALEEMIKIYAAEVEKTNLRVNLIDPGIVYTKMFLEAMPGKNQENITKPDEIADIFVKLAMDDMKDNGRIFKAQE